MTYKINLTPYNYTIKQPNAKGEEVVVIKKFEVKDGIRNVMLNPRQAHRGFRAYTVALVAKKISTCPDDSVVLSGVEYQVVKESFDNMTGWGPHDGELLVRIYEAEKTDA